VRIASQKFRVLVNEIVASQNRIGKSFWYYGKADGCSPLLPYHNLSGHNMLLRVYKVVQI
jgi:hypothetical protein